MYTAVVSTAFYALPQNFFHGFSLIFSVLFYFANDLCLHSRAGLALRSLKHTQLIFMIASENDKYSYYCLVSLFDHFYQSVSLECPLVTFKRSEYDYLAEKKNDLFHRLKLNRFFSHFKCYQLNRCRTWIEKTKRFDLLDKTNVHDERICQQHFEPLMFLNESQNRLQQYAIPTLYLTNKPPPIQPLPTNDLLINGLSMGDKLFNVSI